MTLGGPVTPVRRIAGKTPPWGGSIVVELGATLEPQEILRASVGKPVVWSLVVYIEGGGVGAFANEGLVLVRPGLGHRAAGFAWPASLKPSPAGPSYSEPNVPARELVVEVSNENVALVRYRIVAVAVPISYTQGDPQW